MNQPSQDPPTPKPGSIVLTACKGYIHYEPGTPTTVFRGQRLYFCLPSCLQAFQENPKMSCLAGDPLVKDL